MVVLTLLLAKAAYDRYSSQDSRDDDNGDGDTNGNSGAAAATSTSQFCNYPTQSARSCSSATSRTTARSSSQRKPSFHREINSSRSSRSSPRKLLFRHLNMSNARHHHSITSSFRGGGGRSAPVPISSMKKCGMYLLDEEGILETRDVNARFVNGKPEAIESIYIMKSPEAWDRFMRFMERYGQTNGLVFTKAN